MVISGFLTEYILVLKIDKDFFDFRKYFSFYDYQYKKEHQSREYTNNVYFDLGSFKEKRINSNSNNRSLSRTAKNSQKNLKEFS